MADEIGVGVHFNPFVSVNNKVSDICTLISFFFLLKLMIHDIIFP